MIRSLQVIRSPSLTDSSPFNPETVLAKSAVRIQTVTAEAPLSTMSGQHDAVLLQTTAFELKSYLYPRIKAPVLWWCEETYADIPPFQPDIDIDGILTPNMTLPELQWSIYVSVGHYRQRELLLQRIEDRKWIEQAKAILCEIKQMTEAEAYEFLRRQAMNERKKIVDISISIINVYRLLREQKGS